MNLVDQLAAAIQGAEQVRIRGGGSKSPASYEASATVLDLGGEAELAQVIEYTPDEFTVTVGAAMRIADLQALLLQNGQSLPFDPLFASRGATVGGTLAAGANGPGRLRYGGVRDFVLGIEFLDGQGERLRGGGKVVKNAAGFDLPKLFVGSYGTLGVLLEVTFKVFPAPRASATVRFCGELTPQQFEQICSRENAWQSLEWVRGKEPVLLLRLAGHPEALEAMADQAVQGLTDAGLDRTALEIVPPGEAERDLWRELADLGPAW